MKSDSVSLSLNVLKLGKGVGSMDKKEEIAGSFMDTLAKSVSEVDRLQKAADKAAMDLAMGKSENIHDVAIAMEQADISFRLMVQVRNKVIEAYQEIMRMQI